GGDEVLSLHGGSLPNGARSLGRWEAQDRFGRDAVELLASRDVPVPAALVPGIARQIVARVEEEPERHVTVGRDREEGGSLHLDGETTLRHPTLELSSRLPVEPVRRPGLPGDVRDRASSEDVLDRVDRCRRGLDLPGGGEVVIARALVADRGR